MKQCVCCISLTSLSCRRYSLSSVLSYCTVSLNFKCFWDVGGPSHGHRASAHKISHRLVQRFQRYARGQTDRRVHHNTPHPHRGGVKSGLYSFSLATIITQPLLCSLISFAAGKRLDVIITITTRAHHGWDTRTWREISSYLFTYLPRN